MLKYNTLYTPLLPRTSDDHVRHGQADRHITANQAGTKKPLLMYRSSILISGKIPKPQRGYHTIYRVQPITLQQIHIISVKKNNMLFYYYFGNK